MADHQKEQDRRPLLYKVEPQEGEQITTQRKPEVKHEQIEEVEQPSSNKEEQIEQLKREFGVYEALADVEREKALALEWTREYQKQEKVEQQPRQEQPVQEQQQQEQQQRKRKQQTVQVQYESPQQEVVPKKRKKEKRESVTEIITRLTNSRSLSTCEAQLFGEKTQFKVLGMRGEIVKIRIGYRVRYVKISDISELKVLSGE